MILWTGDRSGRCLRQEVKGHTSCDVHEKTGQLSAARFCCMFLTFYSAAFLRFAAYMAWSAQCRNSSFVLSDGFTMA